MADKLHDLFSDHAQDYQLYRPHYPAELFEYLASLVDNHEAAWDCATGNGQAATHLAKHFQTVFATDLSTDQLAQAQAMRNIIYSQATAEQSGLDDNHVSLVTVCQALHWFNERRFFDEVKRVTTDNAVLAIIGYHTVVTGIPAVDEVYQQFCFEFLWEKQCWAMDRNSLNENYCNIDFPFKRIQELGDFSITMQWSYQDYLNYLNTWSSVKTYTERYGNNAVTDFVIPKIRNKWPKPEKKFTVNIPLIGKIIFL